MSENVEPQKPPHQTTVIFGYSEDLPVSEAKAHFTGRAGQAAQLNPKDEEFLRSSHIDLGKGRGAYGTVSQGYGQGEGEFVRVDPQTLKDIKATHFAMGSDSRDYNTEHRAQFIDRGTQEFRSANRPHTTSIDLGCSSNKYRTIYQSDYNKS